MVWGKHSAYIERSDTRFREQIDRSFARLQVVDDVTEVVDDNVLKITVFDFGTAEFTILPFLESFQDTHKVAVGSTHWVDVNTRTSNKVTRSRRCSTPSGSRRHRPWSSVTSSTTWR